MSKWWARGRTVGFYRSTGIRFETRLGTARQRYFLGMKETVGERPEMSPDYKEHTVDVSPEDDPP